MGRKSVCAAFLGAVVLGCGTLHPYRTPDAIPRWRPTEPPRLSLAEKVRVYQERLEQHHQMPDGLIRYRWYPERDRPEPAYGNLADGPYFTGMYLASQSFRFAAGREAKARAQIALTLNAMGLLAEVSGVPGLLARYYAPRPPADDARWRPSPTHPGYFWRPDVSKDQMAGYVFGLGVTLALVDDPAVRAEIEEIATALADHLIEHDLRIVDWDGARTTHGDLRGRIFGLPIGVNALIALAVAKTAAAASGAPRYVVFYDRLIDEGYASIAYWAHVSFLGITNVDNDAMAYLALTPLLLLEDDPEILEELRRGERRSWDHVKEYRNALFAFVHAGWVGEAGSDASGSERSAAEARRRGVQALRGFPDDKVAWPVDLTREGFDFERSWRKTSKGLPRARRPVPLYLRPMGSSLWTGDPHRLVGGLRYRGDLVYAGADYLVAYWMGRYLGFVAADE